MKIIKESRGLIRKLLQAREFESIPDAFERKKLKVKKKINRMEFSEEDLYEVLIKNGIKTGDTLMVHASWREFYNFKGNPNDVINILLSIIGKEGTLLMPSYGKDKLLFDVDNTPSSAGVLSEIFRKYPNVYRSSCTNFSVCAIGKHANSLTNEHFNSEYGFDKFSPFYKLTELNNSKILFLGLGKKPTKITLFHCAGFKLKDNIDFYKDIFTHNILTTLITNGKEYEKNMIVRNPSYKNDNRSFKIIFNSIKNKKNNKLSNLDIVTIDAREGLEKSIEYAYKGVYCYKKNRLKY